MFLRWVSAICEKSVAGNNSSCSNLQGEGVVLGTCEGDIEKSGAEPPERHFPDFWGTNLVNF